MLSPTAASMRSCSSTSKLRTIGRDFPTVAVPAGLSDSHSTGFDSKWELIAVIIFATPQPIVFYKASGRSKLTREPKQIDAQLGKRMGAELSAVLVSRCSETPTGLRGAV